MKIALGIIALLIGFAVAAALSGPASWRKSTAAATAQLSPRAPQPSMFDAASLDVLPPPVARYLRMAITDGHPIVRAAIATQEADFFINGSWRPLTATQHFSISPPGFVWDARIEMAPLMPVLVRDAYIDRRAQMRASLYGLYSLANQVDQPQLNAGALQRFLGESIWFPTALLPSSTVAWSARDDRSATVTLTDGGQSVSLLFVFADSGMPVSISGDRYKEDNGSYSIQPWQITCGENTIKDGMTIPLRCEVAWTVNGMRQAYWRGRILSIAYQYEFME